MALTQKYTMHHSTVLDADPDSVWAEVRDVLNLVKILFGDTVENVRWTAGGPGQVPSRYEFMMLPIKDLAQQEVVGCNELERSVNYRSVGLTLCLFDYVATYRVRPVTTDPSRSFLEYSREFRITDDAAPEIVGPVLAMMENQINVVRDYFATPEQHQQP